MSNIGSHIPPLFHMAGGLIRFHLVAPTKPLIACFFESIGKVPTPMLTTPIQSHASPNSPSNSLLSKAIVWEEVTMQTLPTPQSLLVANWASHGTNHLSCNAHLCWHPFLAYPLLVILTVLAFDYNKSSRFSNYK